MSIEVALSKLRSAQICHPNAVQFLIDEAITAIQQAEVTDADIEQVLALAHSYADAKLMRYGALGIKEPPDPSAAFIELRRAILSLRPEKVPMTNEELKAARLRVCDDPNELPEPWAFRMGVYAAEAHHGITAQAKKETP